MIDLIIVSGGQTGVDRGALDAALAAGLSCGGFCPAGRRAEDGRVPGRYPLTPTTGADYAERTRANVADSDGTLILCPGAPTGGTGLTMVCCRELDRPFLLLDPAREDTLAGAGRAAAFVETARIRRLNVAGPRSSDWPGGYRFAYGLISELISCLRGSREVRP